MFFVVSWFLFWVCVGEESFGTITILVLESSLKYECAAYFKNSVNKLLYAVQRGGVIYSASGHVCSMFLLWWGTARFQMSTLVSPFLEHAVFKHIG